MNRRGFLGFLAASPVSAKAAVDDKILTSSGFNNGIEGALVSPCEQKLPSEKQAKKFYEWIAKNGIPEWKMNEIKKSSNYDRSLGLDPDLACLRSVSANFKANTQLKRNIDRRVKMSLASISNDINRNNFFSKAMEKFGFNFGWYD